MYFNATSVTTEILTSAGNVQHCWVSWNTGAWCWPSADTKLLVQLQGENVSHAEIVSCHSRFTFHLRGRCFNCTLGSAPFTCVYLCVCTLSNGDGMEMAFWVMSVTLLGSAISSSSLDLCELTSTGKTNFLIMCTSVWSVAFWDLRDFKAYRALVGFYLSNSSYVHKKFWHVYNCIIPSAFAIWARHGARVVRHGHFYQTYTWKLTVASLFCQHCSVWMFACVVGFWLILFYVPNPPHVHAMLSGQMVSSLCALKSISNFTMLHLRICTIVK